MREVSIDLDRLALTSGEARQLTEMVAVAPIRHGEDTVVVRLSPLEARVDVSMPGSGYALRLRTSSTLAGTCDRCLGHAELDLEIDSREVDQPSSGDPELRSPYVEEGSLDLTAWVGDSLALALPDQFLCRRNCAGLCPECGINLNEVDLETHTHERPPDPRFAKLRELSGD